MFLDKILKSLEKKPLGIFLFFFFSFLVYFNFRGSSLADDSIESFIDFKLYGWSGFLHSCDFSSLYYFHDLMSIFLSKTIGTHNFFWYLLVLFIHSSSSYFLFLFLKNTLNFYNHIYANLIALFSSLIFLCGAYNSENVLWVATYHYAFSMLYLSWALYKISLKSYEVTKKNFIILFLPFLPMLTMHEIVFFFPFAFFIACLFFKKLKFNSYGFYFMIPFGLAECLVLGLTKLIKGSYIPHYGIEHVQNHSFFNFIYTFYQYTIKHLLFIHHLDFKWREKLYEVDQNTMFIFFSLIFLLIIYFIFKSRKNAIKLKIYCFLTGLSVLFFIPVSNMYFMWHFPLQNDRLGYFMSAFLYSILVLILFEIFNKKAIFLSILILAMNILMLRINIESIQDSIFFTEHKLKKSYSKYIDQTPYILNLPYSYKGFYVYRKSHRLNSARRFYDQKEVKFSYIASMPFNSINDSVIVHKVNDSLFSMKLIASNSWFMINDKGAYDYNNEYVKFDLNEFDQSAIITLKNYNSKDPILYCTGSRGFVELK